MSALTPVPAFNDNYIWALRQGDHCLLVDPGDAAPALRYLDDNALQLAAVLITHHHPDHVAGLPALLARHPDTPVFGPAGGHIAAVDRPVADGDSVTVADLGMRFAVMAVPGHTLDHLAFFTESDDAPILFCGDTLFAAGCGRLFEGTAEQMLVSLQRLASLPANTRVCCAHEYTLANLAFARHVSPDHGPLAARQQSDQARRDQGLPTLPSTLAMERDTNPFLRADAPDIRAALTARHGHAPASTAARFAALREWKDQF